MEVAGPAIQKVSEIARKLINGAQDGIRKEFVNPPATEKERINRELDETNTRIQQLRQKYFDRGELSPADKEENQHLLKRRQLLMAELDALDQVATAEQVIEAEDELEVQDLNDDQLHILQYQVGQNALNKICKVCHRKMVLQWRSELLLVNRRGQFYWGCSGYYVPPPRQCKHTEKLQEADFNVLLTTPRSEFSCTAQELAEVTFNKDPQRVRDAIRSIRSKQQKAKQGLDRYRCPVHGERLILKEKKSSTDLHDQFFLGCPRWLPGNQGCNYIVKLKSAAQISAALDAGGEEGVFSVLGESGASRQGKKWYPSDDQRLSELVRAGKAIDEIALLMLRNRNGIQARIVKLGLLPATVNVDTANPDTQFTILTCPSCRQFLRAPKGKRLNIRCPQCTCSFEIST